MAWAIEQEITTDSASTLVLICLANYADKFGRSAFPSVSTIAKESRLSERTIRYRLNELEKLGLIRKGDQKVTALYIPREDRRPVCYDLQITRGAPAAPGSDTTGCKPGHHGVQTVQERGAPAAPNPIHEIHIKKSVRAEEIRASLKDFGKIKRV